MARVAAPEEKPGGLALPPPESQQGLDLLRERLGIWAGSFALLSVTASIGVNLAGVALLGRTWGQQIAHPGNLVWLAAPVPLVAIWAICRLGRPSRRALDLMDATGTFLFCLGWALMSYFAPAAAHPGLDLGTPPSPNPPIGVFANMAVLYLRAAILPSTARRTLLVSSAASLPVVVVAILIRQAHGTVEASSFAVGTALLSLWTVPGPAIVSWVIWRLQQQVRAAQQLGQYTLEAKIGEGGMGVVYRARHALLRRPTAIKLLPPQRAAAGDVARFAREVQQTSRLTHTNTIMIYDYGHADNGVFYYAMEYLDGVSLEDLVRHDGPQPPGRVVHILRQVCGALAEAHDNGLVHRDVKPANLHLCVRGGMADHVKVLDFGLVKQLTPDDADADQSHDGNFVGTPLYMAPESISDGAHVDGRADLYAVGAVAYFLLTGTPPFLGTVAVEICGQHLLAPPEPPSVRLGVDLPASLEALVLRCLAKLPDDRPQSAVQLAEAATACRDVEPWTDDQARQWWRLRAGTVRAKVERQSASPAGDAGQGTVAVDLRARA
jgi:hypothetical protein